MDNGLTAEQAEYLSAVSNPYLAQSHKDAALAAVQAGPGTPQNRPDQRPDNPTGATGGATGTSSSPRAGGGGSAGVPDPAAAANAKRIRDANATLMSVLSDYGLEGLADTVMTWLQDDLSEAEIMQEMRKTPTFTTRFPGIEERRKKGLAPISPGEYVSYERNARQLLRSAGLPQGFYDTNEDFTKFLTNDVSLSELGDRVTLAANAAFKMPKEDRDELGRWGMGPGDITAFWLDPDVAQPVLERKYAAAQLSGAAKRTGFGGLEESKASDLVNLGVTGQEAEQGFGQLVQSKELFQSLDSGEDVIDQDEQIAARFGGSAKSQRRIEDRRARRTAQFQSGGGFSSSQTGVGGLGAPTQT